MGGLLLVVPSSGGRRGQAARIGRMWGAEVSAGQDRLRGTVCKFWKFDHVDGKWKLKYFVGFGTLATIGGLLKINPRHLRCARFCLFDFFFRW